MADAEAACRLLFDHEPRSGAWNMAFDEALLEAAANRGETVLRVFRWTEPTLSLGYFQKELPPDLPAALQPLPRVRRLSGGGAILHHHEWTYSCSIPRTHQFAHKTERLYEEAHGAIITAFRSIGVPAAFRSDGSTDTPFLCFLRADPRDIIVNGHKVVGSAQRRRRGAILQHGSVLLEHSPLAPAIPGLTDLIAGLENDPWLTARAFLSEFTKRLFESDPIESVHPDDLAHATLREPEYVTR